jgi:hypothetical protein
MDAIEDSFEISEIVKISDYKDDSKNSLFESPSFSRFVGD